MSTSLPPTYAQRERDERQQLLDLLMAEDAEQRWQREARDSLAARVRQRLRAAADRLDACRAAEAKRQRDELAEAEFRREQLQVLAERDRLEQLTAERRRQLMAEHRRIVGALLEAKRQQRRAAREEAIGSDKASAAEREAL